MTDNLIKVTVYRFEAGRDREPRYETWQVPSGKGTMVLDALNYIRENHDPTLRFRHSCHMGKCGSCAVMVNGRPGLACWELAVDGMVIEPLRGLPVIADLVVERTEVDLDKEGLAFQRRGTPVPKVRSNVYLYPTGKNSMKLVPVSTASPASAPVLTSTPKRRSS